MKALIVLGLMTLSSFAFAGANGKIFATSEVAETSCRTEAARQGRQYRITPYYSWGGELLGWQCIIGNRDK